ncbi:hypothetical protein [Microvirga arabica]|uniref:hypothetical protein n=1 Tax=Microvirga arabica TaxID=1128671 RepID=UPI00193AC635|nr:hypothetical protein [Microvirga arabica]MBM1171275.1 hypothetical protein [Microvirga arabica]
MDRDAPPLFVIPYSSDTAFVWCPLAESGAISALQVGDATVTILERKKLFRPGARLEALLVGGVILRDGATCALEVTSAAGDVDVVRTSARLARWAEPDTRAVLKLIASRPAQAEPRQILERYLTFTCAWQAPARLDAMFPDGCVVAVDLDGARTEPNAYAITSHSFERMTVQPLVQHNGTLLLWIGQSDIQHLYLEVAGALVQARLHASGASYPEPTSSSVGTDGSAIAEALYRAVESPSAELTAWIAGLCQPQVRVSTEHTTVDIRRAVRLPTQDAAIFIDVSGTVDHVHSFDMTVFGSRDPETLDVIACDVEDENRPLQQKIILRAPQVESSTGCYRVSWSSAGQHHAVWIRASGDATPDWVGLAREYLPVAQVRADVFSTVLHPLATAPNHDVPPGIVQVVDYGLTDDADADIFVFVGNDLEALHRTLLALALTSGGATLNVCLCVFDPRFMSTLSPAAQVWARRYELSLAITCYSSRTSEAQVARAVFEGDRPRLFCRAGAVPGDSSWLESVFASLAMGRTTLVLRAHDRRASDAADDSFESLTTTETEGGWQRRVAAGAISADGAPDLTGLPRFYTFEAFVLAQVLRETRDATVLSIAAAPRFVQSGTTSTIDEFGARLDAYSLQTLVQSFSAGARRWRVVRGRTAR